VIKGQNKCERDKRKVNARRVHERQNFCEQAGGLYFGKCPPVGGGKYQLMSFGGKNINE
jgi:hypothetical protein